MKKCIRCGAVVRRKLVRAKYCSGECRQKNAMEAYLKRQLFKKRKL